VIDITPSPIAVQIGPLAVPWYGLGYAAALILAVFLTQRELQRRGIPGHHVADAIVFVVVLGIIGARLYHVIDQWSYYSQNLLQIVLPPYSGLALYGGVAGGIVGVALYARRKGLPIARVMDAAVPSLFLGQAIARWGNFANQELYGPPTDLPWGIAIDCQHRIAAYPCTTFPAETTGFHPLFFYESMLTLAGGLVALWLSRRMLHRLRDGDLIALWFIWYGVVRIVLETFRFEYNWTVSGLPVAMIIGALAVVTGVVMLAVRRRRTPSDAPPSIRAEDGPRPAADGSTSDSAADAPADTAAPPVADDGVPARDPG
jgi:phosphatidylglycerol:prolipoprotein diacylglycerol transferase